MESHCNANGVLVHLMLFVSIKCFAGKGFCDIFCLCELQYHVVYFFFFSASFFLKLLLTALHY